METKYTNGPWRVSESLHGLSIWHGEADNGAAIATIWKAGFDDSHLEANARLIACAPELFKQLDSLAAALEDNDTIHIEPGSVKATAILAVIQKASK
jgi:hypothetical protein